jgi:hypothetical protein
VYHKVREQEEEYLLVNEGVFEVEQQQLRNLIQLK